MARIETAQKTLLTADDLWELSSGGQDYELVKGELIEMTPPGGMHGTTAVNVIYFLQEIVKANDLGRVMTETGFRLTTNPDTVRSPDVSFIAKKRLPSEGIPTSYITGAPDLAVEVVSPNDTASEIQAKVAEYLTHGTRLVWIVYPEQKQIAIHYPDNTARTLTTADTLDGEDVIPGFSQPVAAIFS